jgi:PII-like signaling protein
MTRETFMLSDKQSAMREIRDQVLNTAISRGIGPEKTFDAAKSLLGAGFDQKEVLEKGGLDAMLQILNANAASDKATDVTTLTNAITGFIDATGQAKTTDSLRSTGVAVQNLWAETKLGLEDLPAIASRANQIVEATHGSFEDVLSTMSIFRDVTDASTGATAYRGATMKLKNAKTHKARTRALAELGVTPEMVDFEGESELEVAELMNERLKAAGPNRGRIIGSILGEESSLYGTRLWSDQGVALLKERRKMSGDVGSFEESARIMEGGMQAAANRAEAKEMQVHAEEGVIDPAVARQNLISMMKEHKFTSGDRWAAEQAFDWTQWATGDVESATHAATNVGYGSQSDTRAKEILEQSRPQPVEVRVTLQDNNQIAIPHKAEVMNVGKNKAGR